MGGHTRNRTKTDLSVREQVVVHKVCDTQLACAAVSVSDTDALCLYGAAPGRCRHVRNLDRHHNRRRDDVRVHEQKILNCREVSGRCLLHVE